MIALGMAVTNCRPIDCKDVGLYTYRRFTRADITIPRAEWNHKGVWTPIKLIHWGNFGTMKAFYLFEVAKTRWKLEGKTEHGLVWAVLYRWKMLYFMLHVCDFVTLGKRIRRRVKIWLERRRG